MPVLRGRTGLLHIYYCNILRQPRSLTHNSKSNSQFLCLQDPARTNVDSKHPTDEAVLAQSCARQDGGAVAASLNGQSNNNSDRSMNSKLLFMPSASCQPPTPTLPPLPDSPATGLACSSSALSYSSSVVPPKPDASGAAIGIPIPPPQPRSPAQGCTTTLPPLRNLPSRGSQNSKTSAPQYRKVFVPSTVIHNGVAQQMLVPMICMVAPMRHANGTPLNTAAALEAAQATNRGNSLPVLESKRNSVSGNEPAVGSRKKSSNKQQGSPSSPLGAQTAGTQKSKSQSHHQTRSSTRIAKRGSAVKKEEQCSDTAALTMLADAALMDL